MLPSIFCIIVAFSGLYSRDTDNATDSWQLNNAYLQANLAPKLFRFILNTMARVNFGWILGVFLLLSGGIWKCSRKF